MSHQEQVSEAVLFLLITERPLKYSVTCCFSTVFLLFKCLSGEMRLWSVGDVSVSLLLLTKL